MSSFTYFFHVQNSVLSLKFLYIIMPASDFQYTTSFVVLFPTMHTYDRHICIETTTSRRFIPCWLPCVQGHLSNSNYHTRSTNVDTAFDPWNNLFLKSTNYIKFSITLYLKKINVYTSQIISEFWSNNFNAQERKKRASSKGHVPSATLADFTRVLCIKHELHGIEHIHTNTLMHLQLPSKLATLRSHHSNLGKLTSLASNSSCFASSTSTQPSYITYAKINISIFYSIFFTRQYSSPGCNNLCLLL